MNRDNAHEQDGVMTDLMLEWIWQLRASSILEERCAGEPGEV